MAICQAWLSADCNETCLCTGGQQGNRTRRSPPSLLFSECRMAFRAQNQCVSAVLWFCPSIPSPRRHRCCSLHWTTSQRKLSPNCGASSGSKFMDPRVSCDIFHTSKFPEMVGTPVIIHLSRIFHYNPSILGYPHLWKTPTSSPDFAKRLEETVAGGHVPHGTSFTSSPGKPDNQRDKAGKPEDFTGRSCQLLRPCFVNLFSQRDLHLWD